jgi:putative hydrolase of the HAD superfamily
MIRAVTFDVTHTLLHCPRLGEIYSQVLERHGIAVEPCAARRLIGVVWQEFACAAEPGRDRFSCHPDGPRGWWRRFLERFCEHLDTAAPSPFAAAELFHRFSGAAAWEVFDEVPGVLDLLRARGLKLAVISNWDDRLPSLLAQLGLARRFDAVVTSAAVGVEKPDPRIFRQALAQLDVEAGAALHVGDNRLEDVEGALAAGMQALHLDRAGLCRDDRPGARRIADLSLLPELVAAPHLLAGDGAPGSPS